VEHGGGLGDLSASLGEAFAELLRGVRDGADVVELDPVRDLFCQIDDLVQGVRQGKDVVAVRFARL